jgi:GntR family transcriptional regulator
LRRNPLTAAPGQPLYTQLEELVRERIESGEWSPGTVLPSERELSSQFGLSRMTTRKALDRLVRQGLLRRQQRRGTFVEEPKASFEALTLGGFTQQALAAGASPSSRLLRFERVLPGPGIAHRLGIPTSQLVYLIERLRIVNESPVALHQSHIPMNIAPDLEQSDLEKQSLYDVLLSCCGLRVGHAEETLQSALATEYEARLLHVAPGAPMLLLDIRLSTIDGRPMEAVKVIFRGDRVTLRQEI